MQAMNDLAARLRGYLESDPSNSDIACELVDIYLAEGRVSAAKVVLDGLPSEAQSAVGVQARLGRMALLRGDYVTAETAFETLAGRGHASEGVLHDLAFAQLCQREIERADATITSAIGLHGLTPALGVLKARIAMMRDETDAAVSTLDAVLQSNPNHAEALGVKALALLDGDRMEDAAVTASECLKRYPRQHEALLVAGTLLLWSQRAEEAGQLFETALDVQPNSGRVLSGYGQTLMLRNRLPDARRILDRAVQAMPDHIGTWHALAWTQLLEGDQSAAEGSYRAAYDLDRNFGDTHGGLALISALRGQYDTAEQDVKRALRLDPNAVTAKYAQALVLEARGDQAASDVLMLELVQGTGSPVPIREFNARLKTILRAHA